MKFRILHKPSGELVTLHEDKLLVIISSGQILQEQDNGCWSVENPKDFIIEQYTGLKDKNGKEIEVV